MSDSERTADLRKQLQASIESDKADAFKSPISLSLEQFVTKWRSILAQNSSDTRAWETGFEYDATEMVMRYLERANLGHFPEGEAWSL